MNKHYEAVVAFMNVMGQPVATTPAFQTPKISLLRHDLIAEEISELKEAIFNDDYVEIADALADMLYVIYGAHATFGVLVEPLETYDKWAVHKPTILTLDRANAGLVNLEGMVENLYLGMCTAISDVKMYLDELLVETYRIAAFYGIDIHPCFDEVHASNMSKFCKSQHDAEWSLKERKRDDQTSAKYKDAEVHQVDENTWILRRSGDHKVLKGLSYFDPNLKQFLADL